MNGEKKRVCASCIYFHLKCDGCTPCNHCREMYKHRPEAQCASSKIVKLNACTRCHWKKRRCSRDMPSCLDCRIDGVECEYEARPPGRKSRCAEVNEARQQMQKRLLEVAQAPPPKKKHHHHHHHKNTTPSQVLAVDAAFATSFAQLNKKFETARAQIIELEKKLEAEVEQGAELKRQLDAAQDELLTQQMAHSLMRMDCASTFFPATPLTIAAFNCE